MEENRSEARKTPDRRNRLRAVCMALAALLLFCGAVSAVTEVVRVRREREIKVFVGSSNAVLPLFQTAQMTIRSDTLRTLAEGSPELVMSAVIVLDDYYPAEAVETLASQYALNLAHVWLWLPGETGRAALSVYDNDVAGAVERWYEKLKSMEETAEYGQPEEDMFRVLDGSWGIFALTADAPCARLDALSRTETVKYVDPKYDQNAEKAAAKRGVSVQYIELPFKPDGAA